MYQPCPPNWGCLIGGISSTSWAAGQKTIFEQALIIMGGEARDRQNNLQYYLMDSVFTNCAPCGSPTCVSISDPTQRAPRWQPTCEQQYPEGTWMEGGKLCEDMDLDRDGVSDDRDNCQGFANVNQVDTDGDEQGDACDNCPQVANVGQEDRNRNSIGDECEPHCYYLAKSGRGLPPQRFRSGVSIHDLESILLLAGGGPALAELYYGVETEQGIFQNVCTADRRGVTLERCGTAASSVSGPGVTRWDSPVSEACGGRRRTCSPETTSCR